MNTCRFLIALLIVVPAGITSAAEYPYDNVGPQSAVLSIDTANSTPFNNSLMGLNTNFPENLYGLDGYNDADGQTLITTWAPPTLRFPHGVWANYYDWEVDGRRIYDDYVTIYRGAVENVPQLRYGYPGFKNLHDNLGFDVLHTWNINYDSPTKGLERLIDRRLDGFAVSRIELGNETFWRNQRSNAVATPELYVGVARAHSAALKGFDPTIQLSVPVTWRTTGHHVPWNAALAADQSYYDAVSLHRYIRPGQPTVAGLQEVLDARTLMIQTAEATRAQFPNKPIWLSEWSVDAGRNAISVLGMSDTYLGIFDRPDLFESAEYFQIHNHDPLIIYEKNGNPECLKTTRGAAYDILRNVFVDSDLISSTMTSSEITSGVDAVTAKAVLKNGQIVVYVINKSPVSASLSMNIDGSSHNGSYVHEALQFNEVDDFPIFDLADKALTPVTSTPGSITLPPLSISVLSGFDDSVSPPSQNTLVAGWDTWANGVTSDATVVASGVTGSAVTTSEGTAWNVIDGRGASADGDWGKFAEPPTASTTGGSGVQNENLELSNATIGGTITFTITNNGATDIELDGFHFDAYAFRPKAARAYQLSVASGDITGGVIYTSADDEITSVSGAWDNNAHDDISHSLAGLADHTLEAGGTVSFLLSFSSGTGDGSGGHDLWVDNVAVTGTLGSTPFPLGDVNLDSVVSFSDIPAFIAVLSSGTYQSEADCDGNGTVNFTDIPAFIAILSEQ